MLDFSHFVRKCQVMIVFSFFEQFFVTKQERFVLQYFMKFELRAVLVSHTSVVANQGGVLLKLSVF